MKKIIHLISAVVLASTLFIACSSTRPVCATSNEVGSKVGTNTAGFVLGIIPIGGADFGIAGAARNGGIKKISTVDLKITSYLGLYVGCTTIVTGE